MILIDSHVHFHKCFKIEKFFSSVFQNFSTEVLKHEEKSDWYGVLCLTEISGSNFFEALFSKKIAPDEFSLEFTNEEESVIVKNKYDEIIIVIAGKQIIAQNGIEVLALGTTKNFETNNCIEKTISEVNESSAIAVLPWGVGKWLGRKKEIIKKFVFENSEEKFFLGDNSGRPSFWAEPDIFEIGKSSNHFILAGTDALAIPREENKTGTYGFYLNSEINLEEPAKDLLSQISNLKAQPKIFGNLENPVKFFKNQITMQMRKRI